MSLGQALHLHQDPLDYIIMSARNWMSRRNFFKLSALGIIGLSANYTFAKKSFFKIKNTEIISKYEISVSEGSYLHRLLLNNFENYGHIHISHALNQSDLQPDWLQSYSKAKNVALAKGSLTRTEKFYDPKTQLFSVVSHWQNVEDYLAFLKLSNLTQMHTLLKQRGLNPSLSIIDHSGNSYIVNRYS